MLRRLRSAGNRLAAEDIAHVVRGNGYHSNQ
jgi:hypothetical protein